ncbi:MAG: AAA family ATPase [Clostridiaceae bacterium]|nr:AAA family ATPase [Clostridiaceae bacterium]
MIKDDEYGLAVKNTDMLMREIPPRMAGTMLLWTVQQVEYFTFREVIQMIIWINGAFGVGKTSVAENLSKKLQNSYIYDPENAGGFIWNNTPASMSRKGDFQDIPLWRIINRHMLSYIIKCSDVDLIIPMTMVNKAYYNEIINDVSEAKLTIWHFILTAPRDTIVKRLLGRGESQDSWAVRQMDRCIKGLADMDGIFIDTENRSIDNITDIIIRRIS